MSKMNGRRIESPSSINTFFQCPRKYYYIYIRRLPTSKSIHLIRGSIIHKVLEDFFDADLSDPETHNFKFLLRRLLSLFKRYWRQSDKELKDLGLPEDDLIFYFDESVLMLQNWFLRFKKKLQSRIDKGESFVDAFNSLKPRREEEYLSEEFMVKGFIDVINELDDKVVLMDYKTSKSDKISDAYRLQLAIYALLYEERHGRRPDLVGIDFLKGMEQLLEVDDELINHAKFMIEQIHNSTASDNKDDYPMSPSPLCKWGSGQCDFYDICFNGLSEEEYLKRFKK